MSRRKAAALAVALVALLTSSDPAMAARTTHGSFASGHLDAADNNAGTDYEGWVDDTKKNGKCAYAYAEFTNGQIDFIAKSCGRAQHFGGLDTRRLRRVVISDGPWRRGNARFSIFA